MPTKEGIALIMGDLKREKIREGIARWLAEYFRYGWDELSEDKQNQKLDEAQSLMSLLHSQGVVIRVDRELPRLTNTPVHVTAPQGGKVYIIDEKDMAGLVAVESLIE